MKIVRCHPDAKIPTKGSRYSAGYDLYSPTEGIVKPFTHSLIKTGIKIQMDNENIYGRVAPRSGLAYKHGMQVFAGVIDADYTGEIGVILYNASHEPFIYKKNDRIAQLIFTKIDHVEFNLVETLEDTNRGSNGYGSTGN